MSSRNDNKKNTQTDRFARKYYCQHAALNHTRFEKRTQHKGFRQKEKDIIEKELTEYIDDKKGNESVENPVKTNKTYSNDLEINNLIRYILNEKCSIIKEKSTDFSQEDLCKICSFGIKGNPYYQCIFTVIGKRGIKDLTKLIEKSKEKNER